MAFDPIPANHITGWAENAGTVSFPLTSVPELSAAEARPTAAGWEFRDVTRWRFDETGSFMTGPPEALPTLTLDLPERPRQMAFFFRLQPAEEMTSRELWRALAAEEGRLSASTVAILRTHGYYRLSYPLACLLAVLVGIPLAITRQRGSPMRGTILAVTIMALFYVTSQVFLVLGKNQSLPPLVAGVGPCLCFLAAGLYIVRRQL